MASIVKAVLSDLRGRGKQNVAGTRRTLLYLVAAAIVEGPQINLINRTIGRNVVVIQIFAASILIGSAKASSRVQARVHGLV